MDKTKNPEIEEKKLSNLIVNEDKMSEELIYDLLQPYLRILKNEKKLIPKSQFLKLNTEKKILIWLLGRKAMFILHILDDEFIGPKAISEETNIKVGSIKPTIRSLNQKGLSESDNGKYKISPFGILRLKEND